MHRRRLYGLGLVAALAACGGARFAEEPIFVDGRSVAAADDSILGYTVSGFPGVLLKDRRTGKLDTIGVGVLHSPLRMQAAAGRWFVSDVDGGRPSIVIFRADGTVEQRLDLGRFNAVPHQFGVLPGGAIVIERPQGALLEIGPDSLTTFAEVRAATKPGLVVGANGGIVQALPDRYITLYNEFGHIRWRIDWPWRETAFVSDLAVDANGRIHLIAGVPSERTFIVYSLSPVTGEVVRWSVPGPYASFVVDHFGELKPDTTR